MLDGVVFCANEKIMNNKGTSATSADVSVPGPLLTCIIGLWNTLLLWLWQAFYVFPNWHSFFTYPLRHIDDKNVDRWQ